MGCRCNNRICSELDIIIHIVEKMEYRLRELEKEGDKYERFVK